MSKIQSVGIKEFRANLHKYTRQTDDPIEITSHGEPIGYFIPTRPMPTKEQLATMRDNAEQLSAKLAEQGLTEDDIIADFNALRSKHTKS